MQRPRLISPFSNYSFSLSFPTRSLFDSFEKQRAKTERVFSFFLSVLRQRSSFLFLAVVRFLFPIGLPALISLLLSTMASAMTLETFNNWNIQFIDEEFIFAQSHRDTEDKQILTFGFQKGKCNQVVQIFELYTMTNHPELEGLIDKELKLRENGSPTEGEVIHIQPHKGGHLVLVNLGHYKKEAIQDYYSFHKRFRVTVIQHPLGDSIPLTSLFDVLTHEWTIEDIQGIINRAEHHCRHIPEPILASQLSNSQKGLKT